MTTRQEDEVLLNMVRLRSAGVSIEEIGERTGLHHLTVKKLTNNVMSADIVYSDEPLHEIMEGYWN